MMPTPALDSFQRESERKPSPIGDMGSIWSILAKKASLIPDISMLPVRNMPSTLAFRARSPLTMPGLFDSLKLKIAEWVCGSGSSPPLAQSVLDQVQGVWF